MSSMRPKRRKIRWKKLVVLLLLLIIALTSISWAAMYAYQKVASIPSTSTKVESAAPSEPVSKHINILLMGIDDGDSENPGTPKRSDTMIVLSINPEDGKINLLSIPRDTRVAIPGRKGSEKITHAFFYGGQELAVRTVEDLLKLPIQHYVVIDWQVFIKTIDMLGGVDLYVEHNMHYEDPYADLVIDLTQGYQHLNGSQAGQYVRFRSDELGDIGRVQRQQRFVKALIEQTLQFGNLVKMPFIIHNVKKYIETDMTGVTIVKLVNHLKSFKKENMHTEMLPGHFATIDGLSYWVHDKDQTKQLVDQMFVTENTKIENASTK